MRHAKIRIASTLALGVTLASCGAPAGSGSPMPEGDAPSRPEGPCDIYAADGNPCVAAHSTTRALLASYDGPLYQVMRQSDGATLDIGIVPPSALPVPDPGGYADAAAQDEFCANTYCWITTLYDQSGMGNHLIQAPRGGFSGPAMGGFNNLPLAHMAPITIMGHKAYGIFIVPGMGIRQNDPRGTAVDDQAQGQYWVVNGHHYNSGCCFNYGNAETDSRDDGDGTMETTYFGASTGWYHGQPPGPWVMTDQENNLVGCVNPDPNDKYCPDLPTVTWRFVTGTADGEPGHWRSMGGDARGGELRVMYDGGRIINDRSSYDPMRKQGAILLGNGGDNSNASQGTFYEAAMTAAGTFPTRATNQRIHDNVVAAGYDVPLLTIAPASAVDAPTGLQTFSPGSTQATTVTFTNTTGAAAADVELSLSVPAGWSSVVQGSAAASRTFAGPVAPGATVRATFRVRSGPETFNGDVVANATWTDQATGRARSGIAPQKVRNVSPVRINEFRITADSPDNDTDSFIELYNAGTAAVDLSGWTLTHHPTMIPIFSSVEIPAGTTLPAGGFYVLGLSTSGLAVPARAGETTLYVRSVDGLSVGDEVRIGTGPGAEARTITRVGTAAGLVPRGNQSFFNQPTPGSPTTLWQPLPDGPFITVPVGSDNIPVTRVGGFEVGQKMAIGYGATFPDVARHVERYEVVTVTEVGKPGTQGWLSMDARAGDTNIKVSSSENISVGDEIRLDIDSEGHCIETVTVTRVGTPSERSTFMGPIREGEDPGTGLDLAEPLQCDHSSNMPFSAWGTGITFEPATAHPHSSNEPVLPLGTGITLDRPLSNDHPIHAAIRSAGATAGGFQGSPDQWFGGPALSDDAGSMVLRDADGLVVDGLNYGEVVDPWAAEGYQAESGAGEDGCFVETPALGGGGFFRRFGGGPRATPDISAGRRADGRDADSNCTDFQVQSAANLVAAAAAGATNIKVSSADGFAAGRTIFVGAGANREQAVIATVGSPGATTVAAAAAAGATVLEVASLTGFDDGQTITIGSGASQESAVVADTDFDWNGFGNPPTLTIVVTAPLANAHAAGAQVSGSGITLDAALTRSHANGAPLVDGVPTPGAPNEYQESSM